MRRLIREAVEEAVMDEESKDDDLNKDGKNDFEDVMIARHKASGMPHGVAVKKGEEAARKAKRQTQGS